MLRRLVGDETFWKGVSTFYTRYQNGNALTDDFRRVMEEVSGRHLEDFFRQWVYTPGQPAIKGSWSYSTGVLTVELQQTQTTGTVYKTAIDIGIIVDRTAAPRVEVVQVDKAAQTFTIALDKEPLDVMLDPNTWLLARIGEFSRNVPSLQRPARDSLKAAISRSLRTSRTSPTSTGWFHVLPSTAGNRASSVNWSGVALTSASSPSSDTTNSTSWSGSRTSWPWP